ncbi:MAG: aminotransferase class III-fold pyridoxal phosphate-dependent enzyme [Verrucomicrobiota bacterium]|jgi:glutamate-1-semialdehyde 2,1-aminomutase|nr:aminotransferase class III-fold pyridoxal phosphate-dependent enzyme [Verrucomicrobiota bacterium]MDP7049469.1 aminotransferase class III-fold pyridoxal phosphate-dependent enzyme [Verrucomicrobiota bacterium]
MNSPENFRDRALQFFPGGSNGEYGIPEGDAPVIERGHGCRVWDTDGREYLDMTMAWGAALVGHAHPKVLEAAAAAASKGANFAAVNRPMVELAERIADLSPCVERIRFVASGTESTMLCLRMARAATGRPKILKFEGAYHGQHPEGVTSLVGSDLPELPQPDPAGTGAPSVERDVLVAPYNDLAATQQILTDHAADLAAVIVEPLHRCIAPVDGFLQGLREATTRLGIVLVFDEVVTGFRLALGGAQEYYGVSPDLVAYGKGLGGGFPIGAYGGQSGIMEVVNEQRLPGPNYAWSASTTGGNPVSSAAALAAIDVFSEPGVYDRLHSLGSQLRTVLGQALDQAGEATQVLGDGPLAQAAFLDRPVHSHRDWLAADRKRGRVVMLELLRRGVFLNPMGTKLYLSLAHGESDIDELATHFAAALPITHQA